jgi:HlyD family secretion protein
VKKKRYLIPILLAVGLIAGFFGYRAYAGSQTSNATDLQTATVEVGTVTATLSATGNVRSGQTATITWQTPGKVEEVSLQPGDLVEEGDLLAALDPDSLSNEMIQARQDLIDAQQALDDLLNSTLQQAQALQTVEDAQEALDNLKLAAAEEASQAQLALVEAQEAYEDALAARERMNYPHTTDELVVEKAETDYLLAKAAYKKALQEYNKYATNKLTNPARVRALNNLVVAKQQMEEAYATYNWYLLGYTEAEIAQADAALAVAQANLEAAQAAWDSLKNGTSEAAIALAEATLADAQRDYERLKDGPSAEDIAAAQAAVDSAQAFLDRAWLRAPFDGVITEVYIKTGDLVSAGDAAFRIDDLSSIYVDLQISEYDLASLEVGQAATLEFDAIPDREYTGVVAEIGMVGTVSQGVVNYPVTVRLTDADGDILTGMTAAVTIIVDQVANVLVVPNRAIRTTGGQQMVTVLFEGQQITIPVTVGLSGDSVSEVISDQLREGDTLVLVGSTSASTSAGGGFEVPAGGFIVEEGFGGGPPAGVP